MSKNKKPWSLSEEVENRQQEKGAAHPMEVDYRAALALTAKQLEDLMDDKYLALRDEIQGLRLDIRDHETKHHWLHPMNRVRWYIKRLKTWFRFRNDPRYCGYNDEYDV